MREIVVTNQFKKDLKRARKRPLPEDELNNVIFNLAQDIPLAADKHDHQLYGNYAGCRECHIHPDWLLVYSKENDELNVLNLIRTGSHSDLFR